MRSLRQIGFFAGLFGRPLDVSVCTEGELANAAELDALHTGHISGLSTRNAMPEVEPNSSAGKRLPPPYIDEPKPPKWKRGQQ